MLVEQHFLEQREAELHDRRAGELCLDDLRVDRRADVGDVDQPRYPHPARLGIHLDLRAAAADHPERRRVVGEAVRVGRLVARNIASRADNVPCLHPVFLLEDFRDRGIGRHL